MRDHTTNPNPSPKNSNQKRKKIYTIIGIIIALILVFLGLRWLTEWRYLVTTDDAYVQGDIAAIAPKVSGYIEEVSVLANQPVTKGDVLFRLDDGDYKIAYNQAVSKLETQSRTLARIEAQIKAAHTSLDEASAQKDAATAVETNAKITLKRATELVRDRYVAQSQVDNAKSALDQAVANVTRADAQIASAEANISVLEAQLRETASQTRDLELMRDKAQRDLNFTVIRAPFDGVVGNLSAKKGDFVTNGQRLAALVPLHQLYID